MTVTKVRDSDFKNAFPGIFNFTVGILIPRTSHFSFFSLKLAILGKNQWLSSDQKILGIHPKHSPSPPVILDKEIRAIFLSFLVKTLYGYRKALQFTRIHPSIQTRLVEDMFISPNDEKTFKADLSKARFYFSQPIR